MKYLAFTIALLLSLEVHGQLEFHPQQVRFDSLIAYVSYEKVGGTLFPRNNLVFRNFDKFTSPQLTRHADIEFDTGGGVIFRNNGSDIGSFYSEGLFMYQNKKVMRATTGVNDLLPFSYGKINADGTSPRGTGNYTITQTQTGIYDVVFANVLVQDLIFHVTPLSDLEAIFNIGVETIVVIKDANTITVRTTVQGNLASRPFSFIAYKS